MNEDEEVSVQTAAAAIKDPELDRDDESDDDDDTILLYQHHQRGNSALPTRPAPTFVWQETAVQACFQLALDSHTTTNNMDAAAAEWMPNPATDVVAETNEAVACNNNNHYSDSWQPKELMLPCWMCKE
jgi:hypothetical protein